MSEQWNPNQGTDDEVDRTRSETTDSNAGEDAIMGTVADQPPEMPDNPSMAPEEPAEPEGGGEESTPEE